ncbi:hypothetical protein M2451_002639 [Dysgonomonas sp. PFB1-18]|uniref:hypothetical protein n=1 Tax=unclassified Dysgonomonas TaxID=2630389 RepID=UPI002476DDE4|nr:MULTISPECIES: hypothetical protein [unclassified Dysgonomonas]MDH6308120.1 hypothetical protein [Dysgonomonas sp. PF1-14]MDH6339659.1 hypothetical protein [Dysgonomonas sp. PF1-16]MDH6381310.1 hypothetical protein [Dysgonomonas sp. PFB1-18]MDH6398522.1 hypothetical protein [Dysgonomonas sp. PF1-23]
MTNLEAIRVEVKPYEADALDCEKALSGACKRTGVKIGIADEFDADDNEKTIALAAVLVLYKYLTLSSEKEGEWAQGYHNNLKERIKALCSINDLDVSEFVSSDIITISDGSNRF